MADSVFVGIPERTTQKLTFTLKDEAGAAIPGSSLTTCTLTLYDLATGTIINSRDDVDVKSNVDSAGLFSFTFALADMAIQDSTLAVETHVVLIEWTYASGAKRGSYEAELTVRNVSKVS
jgi:hypothetical protein